MAGNFNFMTLLSTSVAFAAGTFTALQYIQVTPLETEVAVLKEKLSNQKEQVVVSVEYRQLNDELSRERARSELLESQVKKKNQAVEEAIVLRVELSNAKEKLEKYKKQGDYHLVKQNLEKVNNDLYGLKEKYLKLNKDYKALSGYISLRKDFEELKQQKSRLTQIMQCMNKSACPTIYYKYYLDKFEQATYNQFGDELKEVNAQMKLIIDKLPAI
ncbi:hypothetical protein GCE9029_00804 [Grimontia celer]|uniref:Chromosome partition protein Smc n=1 Tax=Grimontia celer TaxID=1796497 RepID=A0A128EUY8_9GAMM|nr:hypothetical protein [Grimontia celer]CZF78383.1 hypothetical protein GCE9029_00804 [Grimontia celer]